MLREDSDRHLQKITIRMFAPKGAKAILNLDSSTTVHVAVHVQEYFFNPSSPSPSEERRQPLADRVAQRIEDTAERLHESGVPTFWICMKNEDVREELADPYLVSQKRAGDEIFEGDERSAIKTDNMLERLRVRGVRSLVVSGGYGSECVAASVRDALDAGFEVYVMQDCVFDNRDDQSLKDLFLIRAEGRHVTRVLSDDVLGHFQERKAESSSKPAMLPNFDSMVTP